MLGQVPSSVINVEFHSEVKKGIQATICTAPTIVQTSLPGTCPPLTEKLPECLEERKQWREKKKFGL